jgi:hypothetical protein
MATARYAGTKGTPFVERLPASSGSRRTQIHVGYRLADCHAKHNP